MKLKYNRWVRAELRWADQFVRYFMEPDEKKDRDQLLKKQQRRQYSDATIEMLWRMRNFRRIQDIHKLNTKLNKIKLGLQD